MERFSKCYESKIYINLGVTTQKISECSPLLAPDLEKHLKEKFNDHPEILRELEKQQSK